MMRNRDVRPITFRSLACVSAHRADLIQEERALLGKKQLALRPKSSLKKLRCECGAVDRDEFTGCIERS